MRHSTPRIAIVLIATCVQLAPAIAQNGPKTWRCGNTYGDQPCAGGAAVDVADPRTETQRRQADEATRQNMAQARSLENARLREEAEQARRRKPPAATPLEEPTVTHHRARRVRKSAWRSEPEHFTARGAPAVADGTIKSKSKGKTTKGAVSKAPRDGASAPTG